jgi:hypothetical protein
MNSVNFCYWLQGSYECNKNFQPVSVVEVIDRHLKMVFTNTGIDDKAAPPYNFCNVFEHIDKSYPNAEELVEIHNGPKVVDGYQPTATGGYHGRASSQVFGC